MKLIYIEWEDARSSADWYTAEELNEYIDKKTIVKQTGWVFKETKDYVALVNQRGHHHWNGDESDGYGHIIKIPKTWTRKRIDLTKHLKPE